MEMQNAENKDKPPTYSSIANASGVESHTLVTQQPKPQAGAGSIGTAQVTRRAASNCPRGLEYLASVDQLLITEQVETWGNTYVVKNALGQRVFVATEQSSCMSQACGGEERSINISICDNFNSEVIQVYRPEDCCNCCEMPAVEVSASGNLIGSIQKETTFMTPVFDIRNHAGDSVLRLKGSALSHHKFELHAMNGNTIGKIVKQWSGLARELFTDADCFGISFPLDLDVRMKAVLLGATFLIDFLYFENN
ncbi:phospholipid scramblase 2-like isoform X2 [Drosophila busckii]|uniref:phospholipid scramblase 2-like isoform X1 n=1 Tax=Drosophila busckii TaxID=30019 RepID=UPI00083EAEB9|nr:phospholipid scramblase 2-like isoform X1 [Drosophila busckii]XP_033149757.1 phospholipid scramblase 2-like isoform X2 [Drosophila busckii]